MHNPTDMRKRFLILAAALLPLLGATAQTFLLRSPELYIGTSHGATASMLQFSPRVRQDILLGYNGGLSVRYVTERGKALQGEVNFSQRGWTERDGTYSRRLTYVEMPLLMNLFWGKRVRFFGNLGPKASFLIGDRVLADHVPAEDRNARLGRPDHWFDYGVTLGLGMEVAARRQCFQLEVRANYSLSTVFQSKQQYDFSNHMNLALNLGWMIRVNKDK